MRIFAFLCINIVISLAPIAIATEAKRCQLNEAFLIESMASCLASAGGDVTGAVVLVKTPLETRDGKLYITVSEKEAEELKNRVVDTLKMLTTPEINVIASAKAERDSPRYASLDLIVTPKLHPDSFFKKKSGYFVQSNIGMLHHDDSRSSYRNITLSVSKEIDDLRGGLSIENSSDDMHMDLFSLRLSLERTFLIKNGAFSVLPGGYLGTMGTSQEVSFDIGALLSGRYLYNDDLSFYLSARRGRFTQSVGAGVEVEL